MTAFTPWSALIGGILIGLSAVLLFWFNGRIAGISGILAGGIFGGDERSWRVYFLGGLMIGAALTVFSFPGLFERAIREDYPTMLVILAGLLVGIGSRLGNGCTSGHGVCGVARLSPKSIVAVAIFLVSGGLTVFVLRHASGILA